MSEVFSTEHLAQYILRLEKLEHNKQDLMQDIKEVMNDAKNNGFDIKTIRYILKLRKMDKDKLAEEEALIELYRDALNI